MTLEDFLKLPGAKVHDGGGMPVSGETRVIVMQRSGYARHVRNASHWSVKADDPQWVRDCWVHNSDPDLKWEDIIAYREAP